MDRVHNRFSGGLSSRQALRALSEYTITLAETDFESQGISRCLRVLKIASDIEGGVVSQHIFGFGEDILKERRRNNKQRNFAVNAAEGQVVDLMAERRNVRSLAGIDIHRQQVLSVEIEVRCKVKGKRRVATLVFAQLLAVDPNGGGGHDAFEVHEDAATPCLGRKLKAAAVAGDEFIALFVKAVPGQADVGVGNDDALIAGVVEIARVRSIHDRAAKSPVPIQRQNQPTLRSHRLGGGVGQGGACDGRTRDEGASGFEEVASVHVASVHGSPAIVSLYGRSRAALSNMKPFL